MITGTLTGYPNRKALKEEIERRGGKVAGSISSKTTYLINNDILSTSSKNKKAKELGIPIISEEIFKTHLKKRMVLAILFFEFDSFYFSSLKILNNIRIIFISDLSLLII